MALPTRPTVAKTARYPVGWRPHLAVAADPTDEEALLMSDAVVTDLSEVTMTLSYAELRRSGS